jgi:hypothetical protein
MPTPVADGVFADTNVWVNAAVLTAPRHAQAVAVVGRPATGALWTSRQVVREFLAVMSRPQTFFPGNVPMSDILNRARLIELQCRVAEDGPDVANSCTTCWRSATRAENRSTMQTSWRPCSLMGSASCSPTTAATLPAGGTSSRCGGGSARRSGQRGHGAENRLWNCLRRSPHGATIVHMVAKLGIVLSCLYVALLGGCSGGKQAAKCVPGASVECACPAGQKGTLTCNSAGRSGACVCSEPTVDAGGTGDGAASPPDASTATGGSDAPLDTANTDAGVPVIVSFTASPTTISEGQTSTLSWAVTGATSLSIDQGIGSVRGKTSQVVAPDRETTTYTLTATNAAGASATAQVTVMPVPLPTIVSFGASPTAVSSGGSATLTAEFYDGTGIVDQGIGAVTSGSGKIIDSINAATTYTLTVTNVAGGSTTAQVTVLLVVFSRTGSMNVVADATTATLLPNGKVLVTDGEGGATGYLASAELYDPATGTFTTTGSLAVARQSPTATLLGNGEVLIAGGWGADGPLASAELYDPATGTFTVTGSMSVERYGDTATLLGNGKVLVAGGVGGAAPHASAELYDPATGTFTITGSMTVARTSHTATLLGNGKVLVVGGYDGADSLASAELYDPVADTFAATGDMSATRSGHTATLLGDGTVLLAGGGGDGDVTLASAELYDPPAGTFAATGSMSVGRSDHTATLLANGTVLVAGGASSGPPGSVELYDPAAGTFAVIGSMTVGRERHTATLLPDGKVLVAGAYGGDGSAELYP